MRCRSDLRNKNCYKIESLKNFNRRIKFPDHIGRDQTGIPLARESRGALKNCEELREKLINRDANEFIRHKSMRKLFLEETSSCGTPMSRDGT